MLWFVKMSTTNDKLPSMNKTGNLLHSHPHRLSFLTYFFAIVKTCLSYNFMYIRSVQNNEDALPYLAAGLDLTFKGLVYLCYDNIMFCIRRM